ncbi:DUF2809 domain-containing protein [Mucilaginibacter aquaedulcis]|uniref:ribosomal maturation YjgA family protein n=1 Tax=Mucilaginibacter aquaedulcis TaxID=1187081 RepID=UPI0025B604DD|nr:DUF2809 domain-containing protein [Mucilaginibacter aquaedulcis]MDN3550738.1 DUF2809 domain-containing protein [Mucilaginibacter aquaedulcis]
MIRQRISYLILVFITIVAGLLSRHFDFIPLFIGDILWSLMIYFIVRFFFIKRPVKFMILSGLLFCYAIEFSQLYQAPWINNLRHTLFGRLVLGTGFLWSDLLCYTVGVWIGVGIDTCLKMTDANRKPSSKSV